MHLESEDKMDKKINEGLGLRDYRHFDVDEALNTFIESRVRNESAKESIKRGEEGLQMSWVSVLKYAAIFVVLIVAFSLMTQPVHFVETAITKNNTDKITLFDGSTIELAQNTILTYPIRQEDIVVRRVILEKGSATFNVVKNDQLPFIVATLPIETTMTGTIFTVGKQDGEVLVSVYEGSVKVSKPSDKASRFDIKKGEKLAYSRGELFHTDIHGTTTQLTNYTYTTKEREEKEKSKLEEEAVVSTDDKNSSSTYRMTDVVNYLQKTYKKKLKFNKKRKIKTKEFIELDLTDDLEILLKNIEKQGFIIVEPGKCEGCFILSPPESKQ
ncbi:MAG: FecR family protein [Saprospiraceae bacterium]